MATVHLSGSLTIHTAGLQELTIEASRVDELRAALVGRFPALGEQLAAMAVAIDGTIYNDADYQKLAPNSEVHFLPRTAGG